MSCENCKVHTTLLDKDQFDEQSDYSDQTGSSFQQLLPWLTCFHSVSKVVSAITNTRRACNWHERRACDGHAKHRLTMVDLI